MEQQWLTWAKQLQALSSTGLFFTEDPYDQERYEQVAAIANGMLASIANQPVAVVESLISDFAKGYATPRVDVRGAVLRNQQVLLVREGTDGLWTLPGGFADIGVSPKENVEKEIREEAKLDVTAYGLYGIRHKARHEYDPDVRDFYKLFFLCRCKDEREPTASGVETLEVGFFDCDALPPLSRGRTIEQDVRDAFEYEKNGRRLVFCD
ncbi:MAG: NUDIX hydrolase [Pseudomonadota bacterium]